jgi:hypothetical protein
MRSQTARCTPLGREKASGWAIGRTKALSFKLNEFEHELKGPGRGSRNREQLFLSRFWRHRRRKFLERADKALLCKALGLSKEPNLP